MFGRFGRTGNGVALPRAAELSVDEPVLSNADRLGRLFTATRKGAELDLKERTYRTHPGRLRGDLVAICNDQAGRHGEWLERPTCQSLEDAG